MTADHSDLPPAGGRSRSCVRAWRGSALSWPPFSGVAGFAVATARCGAPGKTR